jgi:hypothetical protein
MSIIPKWARGEEKEFSLALFAGYGFVKRAKLE